MSAHTPGPWHVDVHTNIMAAGGLVAFPGIAAGFDQKANARLIAAAPELLSTGRAVAFSNGFDAALPDKLEALRAAIAKATGSAS